MKFGKLLKNWAAENTPENADLVLRFKELKKQLKLIKPTEADPLTGGVDGSAHPAESDLDVQRADTSFAADACDEREYEGQAGQALSTEERVFLQTLREDLDKFNDFFIDKEEDFIIRSQALQDSLDGETDRGKLQGIGRAYANLHGSMILLLHWSLLNFTAVVKILKKHDKQTGLLLRQPLLANILKQPFNQTQRITNLAKVAEEKSRLLLENSEDRQRCTTQGAEGHAKASSQHLTDHRAELARRTQAALEVWEEMQANAATPSTVLPTSSKRVRESTVQDRADYVKHKHTG